MPFLSKTNIIYFIIAGIAISLGVFSGVRIGRTIRMSNKSGLTPEKLSNQTSMKIGDAAPSLRLYSIQHQSYTLSEIVGGQKTLIGLLAPECDPCARLLEDWSSEASGHGADRQIVVIFVGTPEMAAGEMTDEVRKRFSVYYCDEAELGRLHVSVFPTLLGIGRNGAIRFIISGYVSGIDGRFFDSYL
jgi:hypothetical protein